MTERLPSACSTCPPPSLPACLTGQSALLQLSLDSDILIAESAAICFSAVALCHAARQQALMSTPNLSWRRLQPDESIYMKVAVKKPGLEMTPIMSELDLTYKVRPAAVPTVLSKTCSRFDRTDCVQRTQTLLCVEQQQTKLQLGPSSKQ